MARGKHLPSSQIALRKFDAISQLLTVTKLKKDAIDLDVECSNHFAPWTIFILNARNLKNIRLKCKEMDSVKGGRRI